VVSNFEAIHRRPESTWGWKEVVMRRWWEVFSSNRGDGAKDAAGMGLEMENGEEEKWIREILEKESEKTVSASALVKKSRLGFGGTLPFWVLGQASVGFDVNNGDLDGKEGENGNGMKHDHIVDADHHSLVGSLMGDRRALEECNKHFVYFR
jgi:hypothetical protein